MLDIMRRKKRLKIVLWLVIFGLALGMLLFFVPGMNVGNVAPDATAATVDGRSISQRELNDVYSREVRNYTRSGANRLDPETLKALGLPRQVLNSLITGKVVEVIADRLGVDVTPSEVRQAIKSEPYLQQNGKFIGIEGYKALLAANNISITDFEKNIRLSELTRKVQAIVTDSLTVSDRQLRDEFSRQNRETQVYYVLLKKEDFQKLVRPTEADLQAYFKEHQESYRIKEKRRARYLLVPTSQILPDIKVSEQEILQEWNQRSHEETVQVAHILIRPEDSSQEADAKARAKAEDILKRIKAGEDFAALAKKYSDDTGSASQGGLLGPIRRGQMSDVSKAFEEAAFALKPGTVSGVVHTGAGYHIIKVLQHNTPTLESSRASIISSLEIKKAQEKAKEKAEEAAAIAETGKDLSQAGKNLGVFTEVRETEPFSSDDNAFQFGISEALRDEVFGLKKVNSIGKVVEHPLGYAVPELLEVQMAKPGDFSKSKARVEKDYVDNKANELMQAEAKKLSEKASKEGSLEKAAKEMGLSVRTTKPFKYDASPDPEIGNNPAFNSAAFDLAPGGVSSPIALLNNKVVLQVKSRTPFDEAAFQTEKPKLREKLLPAIQEPYFQEYLTRITDELQKAGKIRVNPKALDQLRVDY